MNTGTECRGGGHVNQQKNPRTVGRSFFFSGSSDNNDSGFNTPRVAAAAEVKHRIRRWTIPLLESTVTDPWSMDGQARGRSSRENLASCRCLVRIKDQLQISSHPTSSIRSVGYYRDHKDIYIWTMLFSYLPSDLTF